MGARVLINGNWYKQAIFANRFIRIGEEDAQRVAEWASDKDGKNLPV